MIVNFQTADSSDSHKSEYKDVRTYRDPVNSGWMLATKLKSRIPYEFNCMRFEVVGELESLVKVFSKAELILKLEENWDEMGGEKISQKAFESTVKFVTEYANYIYSNYNQKIDIPRIFPSAEGSIDLQWETKDYGILANFDKNGNSVTFYADNKRNQIIEGRFDMEDFNINLLPTSISL